MSLTLRIKLAAIVGRIVTPSDMVGASLTTSDAFSHIRLLKAHARIARLKDMSLGLCIGTTIDAGLKAILGDTGSARLSLSDAFVYTWAPRGQSAITQA